MVKIENNPSACVNESLRGERTCAECYWSQVNSKNQWTGNDECWNSQCLVAAKAGE